MMFINPSFRAVADMVDGDVFIVAGKPPTPYMKCSLDTMPYVAPLIFRQDLGPEPIPLWMGGSPSFGIPMPASFRCHAPSFVENDNDGAAIGVLGCVLNGAGLWLRLRQYWLNLSAGALQTDPPAAPWSSCRWVGICPLGEQEPTFNIMPVPMS